MNFKELLVENMPFKGIFVKILLYNGLIYSYITEFGSNREEHHKTISFRDEFIKLLNEHGIEFDEKYLL